MSVLPGSRAAAVRIEGDILTPRGFLRGELEIEGGAVRSIRGTPVDESQVRAAGRAIVLPGFIDLHVHGGGGSDIMEGGDAPERVARLHVRHGTTALLATTMTAPLAEIRSALRGVQPLLERRGAGCARLLGVHLEGPYINPGKLGAQPHFTRTATLEEVTALSAIAPIRVLTLAPELIDDVDFIARLVSAGIRVQIGHTLGSYEEGVEALQRGASGFTHLFNAMTALHHREPGMVGAALAHAQYSEVIPDLLHAHPGAIRAALRAIPCLYCVTDSTAAAGMPDGDYRLGRHKVTKCLGGVRLADGTLAGSTLTMDQALRNLVGIGLSIEEASHRVSTHAADYIGEPRRGRIDEGCHADLVVTDRDLQLQRVFAEGEAIDLAHAL